MATPPPLGIHRTAITTRPPGLARDLRRASYIVIPAALGILTATAILARTDHAATAVLWLAALLITGLAVAYGLAEPRHQARVRLAAHQLAGRLQQFAHVVLWSAAAMFVLCVALRLVLTDTDVLAVASRAMPNTPGGIGRESLNAGNAAQILDTLTAALPALMILLITAGALRPAGSAR